MESRFWRFYWHRRFCDFGRTFYRRKIAICLSKIICLWYNIGVSRQRGFTILEITLYLSISALLAGSLLFGLAAMVRDQEWHDTLKSTRNLVQTQYQSVANNINSSSTSTCAGATANAGATNCLLIGRYIYFSGQSYTTGSIIMNGITLQAVNVSSANSLPWGSTFAKIYDLNTGAGYNTIAIVRNPTSSAIYAVPWSSTSSTPSFTSSSIFSANVNHALAIAIYNGAASSNNGGALCLAAGSSASNIIIASPVAPNTLSSVINTCDTAVHNVTSGS